MIPTSLPRLAVGAHAAGSGYACIMNAVSYLNGDIVITDAPTCVWAPLRRMAIGLNDNMCTHQPPKGPGAVKAQKIDAELVAKIDPNVWAIMSDTIQVVTEADIVNGSALVHSEPRELCSDCSHTMWLLGARMIGTGHLGTGDMREFTLLLRLLMPSLEAAAVRSLPVQAVLETMRAWAHEDFGNAFRPSAGELDTLERDLRAVLYWASTPSAETQVEGGHREVVARIEQTQTAARVVNAVKLLIGAGLIQSMASAIAELGTALIHATVRNGHRDPVLASAIMDELERLTGFKAMSPTQQQIDDMKAKARIKVPA